MSHVGRPSQETVTVARAGVHESLPTCTFNWSVPMDSCAFEKVAKPPFTVLTATWLLPENSVALVPSSAEVKAFTLY